ncbi:hypothetical protein Taro_004563 [Colocasia esculenta]|uniref:Uncharacterized protein n=1 Tax=Colocasia esculenta TaxID=4460 RepID=A0A843TM91_COLES|nr:hypothetical protein [Colocasia esculenta]
MNVPGAENVNVAGFLFVYPPHFSHEFGQSRRPRTPPRQHPRRPTVSPPRTRPVDPMIITFAGLSLSDPRASSSNRQPVSPSIVSGTSPVLQRVDDISMEKVKHVTCCTGADAKEATSLPPFGLATYKMQRHVWINPETGDHQRFTDLVSSAASWLTQLEVDHPDFNFFVSHFM